MATGDLITLSEFKSARRLSDPLDDSEIARTITVASRWISNELGREFYRDPAAAATTRKFEPPDDCDDILIDDFSGTSGLVVVDNGQTLVLDSDFSIGPLNGIGPSGESAAYYRLCKFNEVPWLNTESGPTVVVTAKWGWPSVPEPVKQGVIHIVADLLSARDNTFGVIGIDVGMASRLRLNTYVEALTGDYGRGDRAKKFGLA